MAKFYPIRDEQGRLDGYSKWPNWQGHDAIEDTDPEFIEYIAMVEAQRNIPALQAEFAALLDELELTIPGIKSKVRPSKK